AGCGDGCERSGLFVGLWPRDAGGSVMRPGERTLRWLLEPITRWLDDPCVTDICINRPGEVWVERLGAWLCEQVPLDFVALDSIATLAAAVTNQHLRPGEAPLAPRL